MESWPLLLIGIEWVLLALLLTIHFQRQQTPAAWAEGLIFASLGMGALVVLSNELLSLFHLLTRASLMIFWGSALLLSAAATLRALRSGGKLRFERSAHPSFGEVLMLDVLILQAGALGWIALRSVPNNYDSLTYHMARVLHWIQNQSVASYATHITRQVQMPPFAEFSLLHITLLSGSDRYVNLLQWSAMLLSLIACANITRKLGGTRAWQIASALICASLPMGVLQSGTTQNDYVAAACILFFVSCALSLIQNPGQRVWQVGAAAAAGLALLTKATSYLFLPPFILWVAVAFFKRARYDWRLALKTAALIGSLMLALNAGHYLRTLSLYGSPLGPSSGYQNEVFSARALASNLIRNTQLHMIPRNQSRALNATSQWISRALEALHTRTGLSATDPRTSYTNDNVFNNPMGMTVNADLSGNPFHMIFILLAVPALALRRKWDEPSAYLVCVCASFVLFSGYLKWQIYGSRLQLPLFVLWAPLLALALPARLRSTIALLLVLFSFPWVIGDSYRLYSLTTPPPSERGSEYFWYRRANQPAYEQATRVLLDSGCKNVGLDIAWDTWEVPLWVLLEEGGFQGRIEHVNVKNETRIFSDPAFQPCMVLKENMLPVQGMTIMPSHSSGFYLFAPTAGGS